MTSCLPHRPRRIECDGRGADGIPRYAGSWYCTGCDELLYVCCAPACLACYQPYRVLAGEERTAPGWRRHRTFSLVACPAHAAVWTLQEDGTPDGPHFPRLEGRDPAVGVCACGELLDGRVLGEMADSYERHLQAVLA